MSEAVFGLLGALFTAVATVVVVLVQSKQADKATSTTVSSGELQKAVDAWKDINASLQARVAAIEAQNDAQRTRIEVAEARIDELEDANQRGRTMLALWGEYGRDLRVRWHLHRMRDTPPMTPDEAI